MTAPAWMVDAACADADPWLFFDADSDSEARSKAICAACPVKAECLDYAMGDPREEHGVWGGLSERERRNLARRRGLRREAPCPDCGTPTPVHSTNGLPARCHACAKARHAASQKASRLRRLGRLAG